MIGQPGEAARVQDEEVGAVGQQLTGLIHPADGGRGVGANQSEENEGEARVRALAVVSVHTQDLRLD